MPKRQRAVFASCVMLMVLPSVVAAQAGPLHLNLLENVLIEQRRVSLADLVQVSGDPAAQAVLARIDVSHVVKAGYTARLSREQIAHQLARQGEFARRAIAWDGAATVTIRSATDAVPAEVLVAAAVKAAHSRYGERFAGVRFAPAAPVAALEVPSGCTELRPRPLSPEAPAPRVAVWLDAVSGTALCRSVLVPLTATLWGEAYVARRELPQGTRASASDFEVRSQNLVGLDGPAVAPRDGQGAWRLRRPLRAGQVLTVAAVATASGVVSGDPVRLHARTGPITIETSGTALANAEPGQLLAVRPAGGTTILTGRLGASATVSVE